MFLFAFDLLELDGKDLRREPLEVGQATLGECKLKRKAGKVDQLTVVADKVFEMARAIDHIANRFDGKPHETVDVTTNTRVKVRYESYEEARAALLEEGVDINRIPMLTDMRPPEGQGRN